MVAPTSLHQTPSRRHCPVGNIDSRRIASPRHGSCFDVEMDRPPMGQLVLREIPTCDTRARGHFGLEAGSGSKRQRCTVLLMGTCETPRALAYRQISPPLPTDRPHQQPWASGCPAALRAQLLFLLRGIPVNGRVWGNVAAAPTGKLPALHILRENRLVAADDIRSWLDAEHPLKGKSATYVSG